MIGCHAVHERKLFFWLLQIMVGIVLFFYYKDSLTYIPILTSNTIIVQTLLQHSHFQCCSKKCYGYWVNSSGFA